MWFPPKFHFSSIFLYVFKWLPLKVFSWTLASTWIFLESWIINMPTTFCLTSPVNCLISEGWMNGITIDFIWSSKFIWQMLIIVSFPRTWGLVIRGVQTLESQHDLGSLSIPTHSWKLKRSVIATLTLLFKLKNKQKLWLENRFFF